MRFISEQESSAVVTHEMAFEAVREALIAAVAPAAKVFPAVIAHGSDPGNRFSVKAGVTSELAGVKMGFNWPANKMRGQPSHNSVTVLFDQEVGRIAAVIEAGAVNAYRTSAADAVATSVLARPDSRVLTIFGAGHQAGYECAAIARIRPIELVQVVTRDPEGEGTLFLSRLAQIGLKARLVDAQEGCERADIIVSATPSTAPLYDAAWVRPGTHVSCMGADSKGKQEAPPALMERAELFCDLPGQSTTIGELQHVAEAIAAGRLRLTPIGAVLSGAAPGRSSPEAVTVFDSSGIALQDLAIAQRILEVLS